MTGIGYLPALMQRLAACELPMDTLALAKFLVGKILIREFPEGIAGGRIVETEAYPPGDEACHAYRGLTARNRSLFLERGHIYVYRIYGKSLLLNISSESQDVGAGVLLRAMEPMYGLSLMQR
jgi:DNA-3-methyladenine glycosylase